MLYCIVLYCTVLYCTVLHVRCGAGLLVAASLKYADAVIKCFASAMSILFTLVVRAEQGTSQAPLLTDSDTMCPVYYHIMSFVSLRYTAVYMIRFDLEYISVSVVVLQYIEQTQLMNSFLYFDPTCIMYGVV